MNVIIKIPQPDHLSLQLYWLHGHKPDHSVDGLDPQITPPNERHPCGTSNSLPSPCLSSSFKQFLMELEPQLRDVVSQFHQSCYTSCLRNLEDMRSSLMLDMYLSQHLNDQEKSSHSGMRCLYRAVVLSSQIKICTVKH